MRRLKKSVNRFNIHVHPPKIKCRKVVGAYKAYQVIRYTASYRMRSLPALSSGRIDVLQKPLLILGIVLIVLGVFIWFHGAVVSRLLDGIVQNRLVTTGIYAWVRNPLYTAFICSPASG